MPNLGGMSLANGGWRGGCWELNTGSEELVKRGLATCSNLGRMQVVLCYVMLESHVRRHPNQ